MAGPLTGVRVLEFAGLGPGPFAGMLLADMGADVIRIDRIPKGDEGDFGSLMRNDGVVDRGRRSIAIDVKDAVAKAAVLTLIEGVDVLVEGFRPGVMEKLGFGPDVCLERNPALVYGRMTGWGQTGPLAMSAAHDINYIALSGALHAMGSPGQPPPPPLNLVGDYGGGGMLLAMGICAALAQVARGGRGQVIDAAMTDGASLLMATLYGLKAKGFWSDRRESNFLDGAAPFYCSYECADGKFITVGAIEPPFYAALLRLCGLDAEALPAQWAQAQWPELKARLAAVFKTRTRGEWTTLLEGSDACFAPVLDMSEAPAHPHNAARGTFVSVQGVPQPAPAPRFSATPSEMPAPAPPIGHDSRAVLLQAGIAPAQIEAMLAAGVLHQSTPSKAEHAHRDT